MHQLGKRSFFSTNLNLSPLSKNKKSQNIQKEKNSQSQEFKSDQKNSLSLSLLARIKKRTFSLSKLQSVQQSLIGQQISSSKKNDQPLPRSLTDRIFFQKLNLNSIQPQREFSRTNRQRNQRNPFFQSEADEQISLLKMILKKKQEDLLVSKQKQMQKQKQKKQDNQQIKPQSQQVNNAMKRIKMLKKTQQYEYYDNIVHKLLNNINTNQSERQLNKQQKQKLQSNDQQSSKPNILKRQFRSTSLSNIKAAMEKQKLGYTSITNFSSTQSIANLAAFSQKKADKMIFGMSNLTDTVYEKKINTFIQFLYKINFSNSIYVDLSLSSQANRLQKKTFKVFVGTGNNSQLIKSVIKRRFWFQITTNKSQCNFIWTQDTQKDIHLRQLQQEEIQGNQTNFDQQNFKKATFSLKNKFTKPSYNQFSNSKVLGRKQIQQADASFSRSYMGLKSPYPQVNFKLLTNHIPNNSIIGSKKILFKLMHWYYSQIQKIDPFTYLPHTYHIIPGDKDNKGIKMFKQQQLGKKQRIWIVKPGQNTNRGNGISVASTHQIQMLMKYKKLHKNGELKTYIVQKYLKPFLYNGRKFDIRHYLLITSVNGIIKGYWYKGGYIRTSSQKFDLQEMDNQFIHLTNDAIQKNSQNYGKYEEGNKLSYSTFQRYLDNTLPHKKYDFDKQIIEEMKKITTDVLRAGFMFLDPNRIQRLSKGKGANFQLYGMDFMIDHKFKPYLIEINANPCLEISCPLLQRLIPIAIEHTFRLAIDPLIPPNEHYAPSKRYQLCDRILDRLKFELIFDEKHEGKDIRHSYKTCQNKFELNGVPLQPEQDMFEDDGQQIKDQHLFDQGKQ